MERILFQPIVILLLILGLIFFLVYFGVISGTQTAAAFVPTGYTQIQQVQAGINSNKGRAVAISRDGSTIAIGDRTGVGLVSIFVRTSPTSWSQQGPDLVGSGNIGNSQQGYSVALSENGNTLAVGGIGDDAFVGATWIWTRSGTTWSQQAKLIGSGSSSSVVQDQGSGVALTDDGNRVVIGALAFNNGEGRVFVFDRTGSSWNQTASLTGSVIISSIAQQGFSVDITGDGQFLIYGAPQETATSNGAVWIWRLVSGTWTEEDKVISPDVSSQFGTSVSISQSAGTLVGGAKFDASNTGAVFVFTRDNSGNWTQEAKITDAAALNAQQGNGVSLSNNGNILLYGGPVDNSFAGAVWIYLRQGTTWTFLAKYTGPTNSQLGFSVSISGTGQTFVAGAPNFNGAFIYEAS